MDHVKSGWIEWPGGTMPVAKGTNVDVRLRDKPGLPVEWRSMAAERLSWEHAGRIGDILEYRICHG